MHNKFSAIFYHENFVCGDKAYAAPSSLCKIPATVSYAHVPFATPATLGPGNSGDWDISLSRAPVEVLHCGINFGSYNG